MHPIIRSFILTILFFSTISAFSKTEKRISNNEISIAVGSAYGFTYDRFSPSLQIQYIRLVNPAKFISTGIAYEILFDTYYRHTFLLPIEFWIDPSLALIVSPGFTLNEKQAASYTTHVEARYLFHLGKIRLGPKAKLALNQNENYFSAGVYVGVPF